MRSYFVIIVISCLVFACGEPTFTPKPRAYPRVIYPTKEYRQLDENYCQFSFEYPAYAVILQDTTFFGERPAHPCWFDIYFPDFDASIYCSYAPITPASPADKLKTDAFRMTDWHNKKATYIDEAPFAKSNDVKGVLFTIDGPVASQMQFFVTDSLEKKHFLRGSLYFNTQVRPDSLAPVYDFLRKDIMRMLETFQWHQ